MHWVIQHADCTCVSQIDFWTKQLHDLIHSIRDIKKGEQNIIPVKNQETDTLHKNSSYIGN